LKKIVPARERSKIPCMSDPEATESDDSSSTVPQRRASRAGAARDAKAKKQQTENGRLAKLAKLRETERNDALMVQEWSAHPIAQPGFKKLSDAESLYEAAILINNSETRNRIALAASCSVRIEAVEKAINFIRIMEQRNPLVDDLDQIERENRDKRILDDFKIWHEFAFRSGPDLLDPLVLLRCRKEVIYRIQILHNATSTKSLKDFIRTIVSPAIQAEKSANGMNSMIENEGDSLSKGKKYNLWNLLCGEDHISRGNKAIKSRTDAIKNPLGGLSMAAGWAWIVKKLGIHPKCIVFVDAMGHLANHASGRLGFIKGKLPAGTKKLMRDEGWTCVYDRADVAAERCFSIDVGMAYGVGLLMYSVHIYDITIREISIIKVSGFGSVMFEPYSQASKDASDVLQQPAAVQDSAPAAAAAAFAPESLAKQVADKWTSDILVPTLEGYRVKLQAEAVSCNLDPAIYQSILNCADGESTHLNAIMDHHVTNCAEKDIHLAKGPASLSNKYAPPDTGKNFCLMHASYISQMNEATDADIDLKIAAEPGMAIAITKLMSTGMSAGHKETFRRLLALTPSIVAASVTPGIVNKAFEVAALWPINDVKILARCWPDFKTLSDGDAAAVMASVRGPITQCFEESGMLEPSKCKEIMRPIPAVIFPDNLIDDDAVLNRHGFVSLSHPYVVEKYESRVLRDSAVVMQQAIIRDDKALKERKIVIRMTACIAVQPSQETGYKMKCRCGKLFSATTFVGHEKIQQHQRMFGGTDWTVEYTANGINAQIAEAADANEIEENDGE
jgi:hypothetical protein